jgi:hypothetical protein
MKKPKKPARKQEKGVIPLKDLVPRGDPKGGKGQTRQAVFGAGIPEGGKTPPATEKGPGKR